MDKKVKVGVIGVSGYTGLALTKLLLAHPAVQVKALCSGAHAGKQLSEVNPAFEGVTDLPSLQKPEDLPWDDLDCLFTATPNGVATGLASEALRNGVKLVDLAADFRLKDGSLFETWYSPLKAAPEACLKEAVYGLVEFNRSKIKDARILANPGCYPTASALSILPFLQADLIDETFCVIDAKSGTSGAGKKAEEGLLFAEINESFSAYKLNGHRHRPEIEQSLQMFGGKDLKVRFTPHLLPIKRGILCTVYLKAKSRNITPEEVQSCLRAKYELEPFVKVVSEPPHTKHVYGSNRCHIYGTYDPHTELVVLVSVIDNLMKGAAGQALQNFNLMFGLEETLGLKDLGILP